MSSYLGPLATQIDYDTLLAKLKSEVEFAIAEFIDKDVQVPHHLVRSDYFLSILTGTVGGGGGGGGGGGTSSATIASGINSATDIDAIISALQSIQTNTASGSSGLTEAETASAVATALNNAGLQNINDNTDGLEAALASIATAANQVALLSRIGLNGAAADEDGGLTPLLKVILGELRTDHYWEQVEGDNIPVSGDDASVTTLTIPPSLAAEADRDVQAVLSINPNPSVLRVFDGDTVSGLNLPLATAILRDTIRWGFGLTLSATEGGRWSPDNGTLTITGRPNILKFEALNTSNTFPSTVTINWFKRSPAS